MKTRANNQDLAETQTLLQATLDAPMTREDVARMGRVCTRTVLWWEQHGLIKRLTMGRAVRYSAPEIRAFLAERRRQKGQW